MKPAKPQHAGRCVCGHAKSSHPAHHDAYPILRCECGCKLYRPKGETIADLMADDEPRPHAARRKAR